MTYNAPKQGKCDFWLIVSPVQDTIKEKLLLAQKYSAFDINIKNCIPLLTNNQIYTIFENPSLILKMQDKMLNLSINTPIPYLLGYLFFESLSKTDLIEIISEETKPEENKNHLPSDGDSIVTVTSADKTKFYLRTIDKSETKELTYYDERGQLYWSEKRKDNTNIYLIEKYNRSAKLIESYEIQNNVKNGEYRQFDNYSNLYQKGNFLKGVKSGIWTFYSDGEIIGEINYKDGQPTSFEKKSPDGSVIAIVELDSIGKGNGKAFFKNGQIQMEGDYINYKKTNLWKIYNTAGKLLSEIQYNLFGEKQKITTFYENQTKHFEIPYKGSLINGKVLEFYKNGKIKGEFQIEKGIPTPTWVVYSEDGKISGEWLADNSYLGTFKNSNDSELSIIYSLVLNNTDPINFTSPNSTILEIEGQLNLMYSRNGEKIIPSVNGPTTVNIVDLKPNENFRGLDYSTLFLKYGLILNKANIKKSILYQILSWNEQLNNFVEDSDSNCYFLMNNHIIYKFYMENHKVTYTEFFEFSDELF